MRKFTTTLAFAVAGLCCAVPTFAATNPTISIGVFTLAPNTPNQLIPIYVTGAAGGTAVQGIDLYAQTGDGGTATGGTAGPVISAVDLKPSGGLFANFSGTPKDPGSVPQVAVRTFGDFSGTSTVIPNSSTLLLNLTVDTTGILTGTYDLRLGNVLSQYNTDFGSVPVTITNGSIKVSAVAIPEPVSVGLIALSGMALMRRSKSAGR